MVALVSYTSHMHMYHVNIPEHTGTIAGIISSVLAVFLLAFVLLSVLIGNRRFRCCKNRKQLGV